ncbi:MAG TPA: HAD family hydrolase [Aggregatilineales bacterium]|nr:HAD family hydrolase [Aggregatilineales bacterium]
MTLKAVLFDLDDTLLDWAGRNYDWAEYERPFLRRAYDYAASLGNPMREFEAFEIDFRNRARDAWDHGRATFVAPHLGRLLVESAEAHGALPGSLAIEDVLGAYQWTAVPGTKAFPEIGDVLTELRDNGLKIAIVTNAFQPMTVRDAEIAVHGILPYFPEYRFSAADVGYLKPHAAIFQHVLEAMEITPAETVFVGDNLVADVSGAQGVGMKAVHRIVSPEHSMMEGLIVPDASLRDLRELLPILDQWYPGWRSR